MLSYTHTLPALLARHARVADWVCVAWAGVLIGAASTSDMKAWLRLLSYASHTAAQRVPTKVGLPVYNTGSLYLGTTTLLAYGIWHTGPLLCVDCVECILRAIL